MQHVYAAHGGLTSVSLIHHPEQKSAIVTEVVTLPRFRGRGWASELLREVCSEADREGVELVLKVETSPGGLTEAELLAWYQRHGFTPVSADPEGLTLRRRPGSR